MKKARHKRAHAIWIWFHFYQVQERSKFTYGEKKILPTVIETERWLSLLRNDAWEEVKSSVKHCTLMTAVLFYLKKLNQPGLHHSSNRLPAIWPQANSSPKLPVYIRKWGQTQTQHLPGGNVMGMEAGNARSVYHSTQHAERARYPTAIAGRPAPEVSRTSRVPGTALSLQHHLPPWEPLLQHNSRPEAQAGTQALRSCLRRTLATAFISRRVNH